MYSGSMHCNVNSVVDIVRYLHTGSEIIYNLGLAMNIHQCIKRIIFTLHLDTCVYKVQRRTFIARHLCQ